MLTGLITKDNGSMTSNTARVWSRGLMEHATTGLILRARRRVAAGSHLQTGPTMRENFTAMKSQDLGTITGLTDLKVKVNLTGYLSWHVDVHLTTSPEKGNTLVASVDAVVVAVVLLVEWGELGP